MAAGAGFILLAGASLAAQVPPTWEELEAQQARLAGIEIRIHDVFDPARPHENHWLGRAANFLHIETREQVVRRELLFRAGEGVNARLIHETERNLRAFQFLKDARIEARVDEAGAVHAVVHTLDAWTLKVSAGFSQVGGQRDFGFAIHEANFMGFGKDLILAHEKTPERSIDTLKYLDRQFLGSQWTFSTRYQVLSDGKTRFLELTRPYRGLETPWSMSFRAESSDVVQSVFNLEQTAYSFRSRWENALVEGSWAAVVTDGRALRLGAGLDLKRARFGPLQTLAAGSLPMPQLLDRQLQGIHVSWSLYEDQFRAFKDLAGMIHPEDFNLGWEATLSLGSYLKGLGSDVSSPFFRVSASKGWAPGADSLLLFRTQAAARHEDDGWLDAYGNANFTAYHQGFNAQTQAAYVQVDGVHRPEAEKLLYLGGMDGMRGYGNHLLLGDRRWMASLEERFNTSVNWLGLLQLGFVAYADAGALRRADTGRWSRTYVDVGGGLRLGNLKSSIGRVFLITVAFPLVRDPGTERRQFVIGNLVKF
jgi:hypothetical protein